MMISQGSEAQGTTQLTMLDARLATARGCSPPGPLKHHVGHEHQPTKARHERTTYIDNIERDQQGKSHNPERDNDESNSCRTTNASIVCNHLNNDPHPWPVQLRVRLTCFACTGISQDYCQSLVERLALAGARWRKPRPPLRNRTTSGPSPRQASTPTTRDNGDSPASADHANSDPSAATSADTDTASTHCSAPTGTDAALRPAPSQYAQQF